MTYEAHLDFIHKPNKPILTLQTQSRLNTQAHNFQSEIKKLEKRIESEIKAGRELRKLQLDKRAKEEEETALADAKRAEDKILKGTTNALWNEAIYIKKYLNFLKTIFILFRARSLGSWYLFPMCWGGR